MPQTSGELRGDPIDVLVDMWYIGSYDFLPCLQRLVTFSRIIFKKNNNNFSNWLFFSFSNGLLFTFQCIPCTDACDVTLSRRRCYRGFDFVFSFASRLAEH